MARKGEGARRPRAGARARAADNGEIVGRPYGRVQIVERGRKLFGKERQRIFLEHLAATCNVARSARAAGVTVECVYQRRMKDAAFRAAWNRALEQGYARLEARMLEEAAGAAPIEVDGGLVLSGEPLDKELAMFLLREHKKGLSGEKRGQYRGYREADWEEVEAHFIARLRALKVRLDEGDAKGALHHPPSADGPESGRSLPRSDLGLPRAAQPHSSRPGEERE